MKTILFRSNLRGPRARCLGAGAAYGLLLSTVAGQAADYTVTTNADTGLGSLRQAILDANANPGADAIDFDVTMVVSPITLATELVIAGDLAINGPGADQLTISGNNVTRVFYNDHSVVTIDGLTIANGGWSDLLGGGGLQRRQLRRQRGAEHHQLDFDQPYGGSRRGGLQRRHQGDGGAEYHQLDFERRLRGQRSAEHHQLDFEGQKR